MQKMWKYGTFHPFCFGFVKEVIYNPPKNKHRICGIKDWQVGVEKKDSRNLFWTPKTVTHSTDLQLLTKKMFVQRKQEEIKTTLERDL